MGASEPSFVVDAIVPARNCGARFRRYLEAIPTRELRSVVVVDRASEDATSQVARDAGAIVVRSPRSGYGDACRAAVGHLESLPQPPGAVLFLNPEGLEDPRAADALIEPLRTRRAQLVLGVAGGGRVEPADRVALRLIQVLYQHRFAELGSFRGISFPALVALGLSAAGSGWNAEMMVKALRFGLAITEVSVPRVGSGALRPSRARALSKSGQTLYRILRHSTAR